MAEKKKNEHQIMNEIRLWCGQNDVLCFRANVGRVKGEDGRWFSSGLPSGFSDLLLLIDGGKTAFIEVKDEKGKQREDQKAFQKAVTDRGFTYALVRSVSDVKSIVDRLRDKSETIRFICSDFKNNY